MRNEVKVGRLPNGFMFYSQYDWSGGSNLAGIGIRAGSIHTSPGCVGLPHLVEHLLARESLKYSSEDAELIFEKFLGGPDDDINIRIDRVSTNFGFGDLLRKKDMLACLDVMANFLRDKIITSEGIDVEKAAVRNEYYLRGVDVMPTLLEDLLHKLAYESNPARFRIDCDEEDLRNIRRSQINSFIKKHYVANNMFLIMLGARFEEVREIAKEYFGGWEQKPTPQLLYNHSDDLPVLTSIKSLEALRNIGQYHLAMGFHTENYLSNDAEAIDVLAKILAFRLRRRLRDGNRDFNAGVYRANVDISRSFVHGLIYAKIATTSPEFAKKAENIILEEFLRLTNELVSERELEAMKYRMYIEHLQVFSKIPDSLVEMIIEAACNGDEELTRLHSFRQRLEKIKQRNLLKVAIKYFSPNYLRVLIKPA